MKHNLLNKLSLRAMMFVAFVCAAFTGAWAGEETVVFSEQGYENAQAIETYEGTNFSITFNKGTNNNAPKYYTTGAAIRAYGGNYFTVSSDYTMTDIALTFASGEGTNAITTDVDTYEDGTWTGSANEVTFTISGSTGHRRIASVTVTFTTGGAGATTVVTIDDSGITNTNVFDGTAAGKLTATVSVKDGDPIEGATVTWSGDNDEVATIDAEGVVTLVAAGSVTFTASYAGVEDTYNPSSKTYKLTVINWDPNGPGTANNPYTPAQAIAAIDAGQGVTGVYAKGIVSQIVTAFNPRFGNITYNISADGTTEGEQLQAYRGFSFEGEWFTSEYGVMVGDEVVIYGNLKKYGSTYEFDANNYLVSQVRKPVKVVIGESGYATAYMPYPITFAGGGAPDAEDLPTPVGAWTFDNPENPLAGTGTATLTPSIHGTNGNPNAGKGWLETKESLEAAGIEVIDGGALYLPKGSSLLMNTNNGAEGFDKYTVMFDISSDDMSGYTPLWQNNMTDSKDGSLFIKNGQMGLGGSLGYNGNFTTGVWYRVVLVIDTPNKAALYVDGELLSACEHEDSYNKHWLLQGPGAVFFADEDGEEKAIKVTGLRFWDVPFTADQVAALGTVAEDSSEDTPEIFTVPETTGAWTFEGGTPNGTGVATMTATSGVVANEDGSITVDEENRLELTTNLQEESLSSYTLMMDVKFPDVDRYTSLIQTDLENVNDACLFVHNGKIGINSAGMYYHGALQADTWYRIVFVVRDLYAEEYVDGKLIGKSAGPLEKWGMSTGLYLFEDEDEDNDEGIATVMGIQFWNEAFTPQQVAMLGTVGMDGTVKAYTGKIVNNYLSLTEVEGTVPAETAVILKGAPGTYFFEIGGEAAEVGENDLKGTFEEIDAEGKYVLAQPEGEKVGFYKAVSGTIAAGKAYLDVASEIKAFYFNIDDDATGIESIQNSNLKIQNDGAIYNLAGQRIQKMQKGINIVNGKKILQ